jgi:hypothetical protein
MKHIECTANETFEEIYEPRTEGYEALTTHNVVGQVMYELEPLLEQLESLWPTMPKVEPDGYSECPFAEDLYRKKFRLEGRVADNTDVLQAMLRDLEGEVERCARNLERIGQDTRKLRRPEPRKEYAVALNRQEQEYKEAASRREAVIRVLQRAHATLSASRKKAYPIPLTGESGPARTPYAAEIPPSSGTIEQEVDDLVSIGSMPTTSANPKLFKRQ